MMEVILFSEEVATMELDRVANSITRWRFEELLSQIIHIRLEREDELTKRLTDSEQRVRGLTETVDGLKNELLAQQCCFEQICGDVWSYPEPCLSLPALYRRIIFRL